jgi:hypothetical protein
MSRRPVAALLALLCAWGYAFAAPDPVGEGIYRHGVTADGAALVGEREAGLELKGEQAACVNCHRRSGLGQIEARVTIPPISGPYLFHPRAKDRDDLDLPFVEGMRPDRDPYTDSTLARAIREGVGVEGKPFSRVMPRYPNLNDADMAGLIAYLKKLTPASVPGVTDSVLHFATIITPDSDPTKRRAMLDVLNQYFTDKNAFARAESSRLRSSRRMMFKANRHWLLHVWELTGPAEGWEQQLRQHLAREPVFAVLSGIGGRNWAPVHHFCESMRVPCLFPNVELPVVAEEDFYSLYFSRGVLLEADLIAQQITEQAMAPSGRIVQIYRKGDVGPEAAQALKSNTKAASLEIPLDASAHVAWDSILKRVKPEDDLVLWLRGADIAAITEHAAPTEHVFTSGLMAGLDAAPVASAWRARTRLAYGFDLPDKRRVRMDYPLGWFAIRKIPVVAEQVQADTYLACGLLSETINRLSDSFIREYLIERLEGMLEHRIITAYYPHLSLGVRQRFASKGGYIVHFDQPQGPHLAPDTDWVVP